MEGQRKIHHSDPMALIGGFFINLWWLWAVILGIGFGFHQEIILKLSIVLAAIASIILTASRFTYVTIEERGISITGPYFRKAKYDIRQYRFVFFVEKNLGSIVQEHVFLRVIDQEGRAIEHDLRYFTVGNKEKMLADMALKKERYTINRNVRPAGEIFYTYEVPKGEVMKREWKRIGFLAAVGILCAVIALVILNEEAIMTRIFFILATLIMGIIVIAQIGMLILNQRKYLWQIVVHNRQLIINGTQIPYSRIRYLKASTCRSKSSYGWTSNVYVRVHTDTEKYKFWLGTGYSIWEKEYQKLYFVLTKVDQQEVARYQ